MANVIEFMSHIDLRAHTHTCKMKDCHAQAANTTTFNGTANDNSVLFQLSFQKEKETEKYTAHS